jgi:hypothetical protein
VWACCCYAEIRQRQRRRLASRTSQPASPWTRQVAVSEAVAAADGGAGLLQHLHHLHLRAALNHSKSFSPRALMPMMFSRFVCVLLRLLWAGWLLPVAEELRRTPTATLAAQPPPPPLSLVHCRGRCLASWRLAVQVQTSFDAPRAADRDRPVPGQAFPGCRRQRGGRT